MTSSDNARLIFIYKETLISEAGGGTNEESFLLLFFKKEALALVFDCLGASDAAAGLGLTLTGDAGAHRLN